MRIYINTTSGDGKRRFRLWLWLPNCVVTGAPAAWLVSKSFSYKMSQESQYPISLTYEEIRALQKTLKPCRRNRHGRPGIEVYSHNGQHVTIRL